MGKEKIQAESFVVHEWFETELRTNTYTCVYCSYL